MIPRGAVFFFMLAGLATACECVGDRSQQTARSVAFAVFEGVVTDIHHFENEEQQEFFSRVLVTFKIARSWKGTSGSTIQVHAWERAILCESYKFRLGNRYVVYAVQQDIEGGWTDRYPTGTKILTLGDCILRIREDTDAESQRLGEPITN